MHRAHPEGQPGGTDGAHGSWDITRALTQYSRGILTSTECWNKIYDYIIYMGDLRVRTACDDPSLTHEERLAVVQANRDWHNANKAKCLTLLRHIMGNPFRPYPAPEFWPSNVVLLAQALYEGQDCDYALHDALEEAGHPELAEHFRQREHHPKGCWVVDLILGKK